LALCEQFARGFCQSCDLLQKRSALFGRQFGNGEQRAIERRIEMQEREELVRRAGADGQVIQSPND
jgi:hypothetical protein